MSSDYIDYNVIGGHRDGKFIPCVVGAADSYLRFDSKHRIFLYGIMAVASDLGNCLINNHVNIKDFCSMDVFTNRRCRPKPSDDEATLLHYLSIRIFSTGSKENDNNATVYGRVLGFFWREGIAAGQVIQYLHDNGGIYGLYDLVKKKYPGKKSHSTNNTVAPKNTASSNNDMNKASALFKGLPADNRATTVDDDRHDTEYAAFEIIEINGDKNDLSRFLQLKKGEKLTTVVECVDWRDEWVVLKFVRIRDYPVIIETSRR